MIFITAWEVSIFEVFLVRIFPHSDWIQRDTEYLSVFSPNGGKYGPKKLQSWTLFTQCLCRFFLLSSSISLSKMYVFSHHFAFCFRIRIGTKRSISWFVPSYLAGVLFALLFSLPKMLLLLSNRSPINLNYILDISYQVGCTIIENILASEEISKKDITYGTLNNIL